MLTFLSCGWSPQRKQSPPLHPSQFSKLFLRSCDQLGEGWWKDRDLFLLRREEAKDISLADSGGDFSPSAPLNPPFRLTIWEYFSCCILSKALSTSSSVKSVKSSLLFRDCVERRVTLRKQLYLCNKVGLGNSRDFNVNCNFGLARSFKNTTAGVKNKYRVVLCGKHLSAHFGTLALQERKHIQREPRSGQDPVGCVYVTNRPYCLSVVATSCVTARCYSTRRPESRGARGPAVNEERTHHPVISFSCFQGREK